MGILINICRKNKDQISKNKNERKNVVEKTLIFFHQIDGKKKEMDLAGQDAYDIITNELGEDVKYFAVYDGHGIKGKEASQLVRYEIRNKLIEDKKTIQNFKYKNEVEEYFSALYKHIQKKTTKRSTDYEISGSCAISVLIVDGKIYVINCGDSRAVLGTKLKEKKVALEMSIDHKPTREDEVKRINESNGEVTDKYSGVPRVYLKNDDTPGLAVSRSIGDLVAHKCGVTYDPEVIEKEIDQDDAFIIIGSDGIWDAMGSTEAVGFVFKALENGKRDLSASHLVEECRNRWELMNLFKQKFQFELFQNRETNQDNLGVKPKDFNQNSYSIDDITSIIYFFSND